MAHSAPAYAYNNIEEPIEVDELAGAVISCDGKLYRIKQFDLRLHDCLVGEEIR